MLSLNVVQIVDLSIWTWIWGAQSTQPAWHQFLLISPHTDGTALPEGCASREAFEYNNEYGASVVVGVHHYNMIIMIILTSQDL